MSNPWSQTWNDGITTTKVAYQPHEDKLYVNRESNHEKAILDQNNSMRNDDGFVKNGNVRMVIRVSQEKYVELIKQYPGLIRGTAEDRRRTWELIGKEHPEYVAKNFQNKYI